MQHLQLAAMISQFLDWHIDIDEPQRSVVFPGPVPVPDALQGFLGEIINGVRGHRMYSAVSRVHESITIDVLGVRFRSQWMRPGKWACRLIPAKVPDLKDLQFRECYNKLLMSDELHRDGGLVLVTGIGGSGKTTTVASTICSRLKRYGGFCLTVEDPPEYPMEGFHSGDRTGYCVQTEASDGYEDQVEKALRCFPSKENSMLMFGEVRSADSVLQLLRASGRSHLCFATFHAKDIETALTMILSMASRDGEAGAAALLGSSLRLIVHQSLANNIPTMQALHVNQTVSSMLKQGISGLKGLHDEISRQNNNLLNPVQRQRA